MQESFLKEKLVKPRRGKRTRRVIVTYEQSDHSLLASTADLGGYPSVEEYARQAIKEKFEADRAKCRAAMARERA